MQKFTYLLILGSFVSSIILMGCPGQQEIKNTGLQPGVQPQPSKVRFEVIQDQQSAFTGQTMPLPEWLLNALQGNLLQFGTDEQGKKVVYFVSIEKSPNLDLAKQNAKLNLAGRVAESVRILVTSEAAKVFEGDQETYAQYVQGAVGLLAKNVKISGLVPKNEYWAELQEYESDRPTKRYFSYAIRYVMDQATYQTMMNEAWEQTKQQKPDIPEEAKKKMDNLIKELGEAQ